LGAVNCVFVKGEEIETVGAVFVFTVILMALDVVTALLLSVAFAVMT